MKNRCLPSAKASSKSRPVTLVHARLPTKCLRLVLNTSPMKASSGYIQEREAQEKELHSYTSIQPRRQKAQHHTSKLISPTCKRWNGTQIFFITW